MNQTLKTTIVKADPNIDNKYVVRNVQIAYPDLYTARPFKDIATNTPRYGVTVVIQKEGNEDTIKFLKDEIDRHALATMKLKKLPEADSPLADGDSKTNEAYHGHWVLNLYAYPSDKKRNGGRPDVVDRSKNVIKETDSNAPYSGSICNVVFELFKPGKWNKIAGGFDTVQVLGGGEVIGKNSSGLGFLESLDEEPLGADEL